MTRSRPRPITLRLRPLAAARREAGLTTDRALAERMRMHPTAVTRIIAGAMGPGPLFIAGLLAVFPGKTFEDFFAVPAAERARRQLAENDEPARMPA